MSNVAHLIREQSETADRYLGSGTVLEVAGSQVQVALPDGVTASAKMALAFPYAPAVDDELLIIGEGDQHWVIGVVAGAGKTSLSFSGDVDLRAEGTLALSAQQRIELSSPEVRVRASSVELAAKVLKERFENVYQRVRSLLSVRAGQSHTIVDEAMLTKAKSGTILTEEVMAINGKSIHLG